LLDLGYLSLGGQVVAGYLVITFIYYWWHRARHGVAPLWRWLHQFHHSPTRIEVITSFYKSPLEIVVNGILSSAILHSLLGLSLSAVGLCVLTTALAELVYHANLKTPRWLGLFFQRPEMHRIHHQRGLHHYNYSDLPLWDMLFGTYRNPAEVPNQTGFPLGNEHRITSLLCGRRLKA
jgi:sterol desaturase/sphingolipid hydroxylase (fatty acid hydroxylase superfamily)